MQTLRDNNATPPDALNEDWRFGRPHLYAAHLLRLLEAAPAQAGVLEASLPAAPPCPGADTPAAFPSIGSGYLVQRALAAGATRLSLRLEENSSAEAPVRIRCEASGLFLPWLEVVVAPGVQAHVVEQHSHRGASALLCLRRYTILPGASLALELREEGSGESRALNISHIRCVGNCRVRHITTHANHSWAREETTAELTQDAGEAPELLLLSANSLRDKQVLDQRTLQLHTCPGAKSRLLYKNVLDESATAVFGGNIRVEPGAHETDAYLSHLNLMLSEDAAVHTLPGLEILADRVRCSHGSACAPMDAEQLFYLLSRGIGEAAARAMLAEGFLSNVWEQFATPS